MVKRNPSYSVDNISHESDNFSKIVQGYYSQSVKLSLFSL